MILFHHPSPSDTYYLANIARLLMRAGGSAGMLVFVQAGRLVAKGRGRIVVMALAGTPARWTVYQGQGANQSAWLVKNVSDSRRTAVSHFLLLVRG